MDNDNNNCLAVIKNISNRRYLWLSSIHYTIVTLNLVVMIVSQTDTEDLFLYFAWIMTEIIDN